MQEQIKTQETLEEAAKEFSNNSAVNNYEHGINVGKYQGFIEGAKWQQKRMYSEDEVLSIVLARENYLIHTPKNSLYINIREFFEQFKK